MNSVEKKIEDIKQNGYELDFSNVFTQAFEHYKKIIFPAGIAYLLMIILIGIIIGTMVFGIVGVAVLGGSLTQFKVENLSILWLLGYIFFMVLLTASISPMTAGVTKMSQDAAKGNPVSIGTAFQYYSSSYCEDIFIAYFLITLFTTTLSAVLQWLGYNFLGIAISLLFSFFTLLTIPLIIFGNLGAMKAIEGSLIIVSRQAIILLGLMVVTLIIAMLGIFGFCIGVLFTMPFLNAMYYSIYAQIIGDEAIDENPESYSAQEAD